MAVAEIKCKKCGVKCAIPSYMLARSDYRCRQCANAEKAAWVAVSDAAWVAVSDAQTVQFLKIVE